MIQYRRPSLFAGVTFWKYSANTKTANNEGKLYLLFGVNFHLISTKIHSKTANNRGKGPRIASFGTNSSTANKRNREQRGPPVNQTDKHPILFDTTGLVCVVKSLFGNGNGFFVVIEFHYDISSTTRSSAPKLYFM